MADIPPPSDHPALSIEGFVWLSPLLMVLGGIVLGWVCEHLVRSRLRAMAARTSWRGDDIIVEGLKGLPFLWCVLLGLYAAAHFGQMNPSAVTFVTSVLKVGWIISLTVAVARIAGAALRLSSDHLGGSIGSSTIFINIVRIVICLLGGLIALESLGISITPILTALGVGGLAVALALQDPLANLFAGLQIVATKKVNLGDYVRVDSGEEGFVTDISWRNTTITTLLNNTVIIPNSKVASVVVTNYHMPDTQTVFIVPVGVGYGSDLNHVEAVTTEVVRETLSTVPGGVAEFIPAIRFIAFADSAITMNVALRAQTFADQSIVRHEFIKRLHARFRREGIQIPFPMRTVIMQPDTHV